MKNILIYSDLHIDHDYLKECIIILEELGMLTKKYNVDTVINLGDTFNKLHPSSQELDIFATWIKRLGDKQHIIIAANSHESEDEQTSILNHYGILSPNVHVMKEFKEEGHLFCGHFILKESNKNFGAQHSKEEFKNYVYVFLGHQHSYELVKPNCVQLGSSRYVNFDEVKDKSKIVALITNYGEEGEQVHFLKLKSPIPMIQLELSNNKSKNTPLEAPESTNFPNNRDTDIALVNKKSGQEASINPSNPGAFGAVSDLVTFLDKTDPKYKIKVKIKDFESFKGFLPFEQKYRQKFTKFVRENDFELVSDKTINKAKSEINLKQSFEEFAKEKEIDKEIAEIINKEIK